MEEGDRLKGLIFGTLDAYHPNHRVLWINMMVRDQSGYRIFVRYDADTRRLKPRRSISGRTMRAYFKNKRFIEAVIAKIPDHIIAELTAHSIALSARKR